MSFVESPDPSPESASPEATTNASAYSVSELAFAMKKTLEDAYGFVRLRGEISKVTRHASGHIYLTLKDERASIDAVVWKGSVRGLKHQPQMGLEVIVTGRITTYPARSSYQLVIETMEPAGVGALLAQLERLKERLKGEGLFELARKRALPASPAVIGVITSPTGAVIRDILHRIRDRWPAHVLVWPVVVQGDQAAAQVIAAIQGFNAIASGGAVPRPEVIIVARGGGSVEDLWPFNDEALARAAAASAIPLISAVGHETDTTLIDFVSDRRAPTPTAAAEMATPVLADLKAVVLGFEQRMARTTRHMLETRRTRLDAAGRGLPKPEALFALQSQRFDLAAGRLSAALTRNVDAHQRDLLRTSSRFAPGLLQRPRTLKAERLGGIAARLGLIGARLAPDAARRARLPELGARLDAGVRRRLKHAADRVTGLDQLLRSLNPEAPLARGYALVQRADGALARTASALKPGEGVTLRFADASLDAHIDGAAPSPQRDKKATPDRKAPPSTQGNLF